jgi:beta-lactamase class A
VQSTPAVTPARSAVTPSRGVDDPAAKRESAGCSPTLTPANGGSTNGTTEEVRLQPPANVKTPAALAPLPFKPDPGLQQRIAAVLGPASASTAVVVKDLQTGQGASINADRSFYPASLFKLFVMHEVFHQSSQGLLSLSKELQITPYYDSFGLGPRRTKLCQRLTINEAMQAMMSTSDNAAAILLQDLVGSGNIDRSLVSLGMKSSRYLPEELTTSAGDVALLLEGIGRNLTVSRPASLDMIRLLVQEEFDNGLRAGLPQGVLLAHKTGNWGASIHDAGLVFAPKGTYVFVVLTEAANAAFLTRELSRTVYEYFTTR